MAPVVDLRLKFGMEKIAPTDHRVIIVVQYKHRGGEISMGILVDEVLEVLNVESESIEPPPSFGSGTVETDVILGVGKYGKQVIFLLDIGKILSVEDSDLRQRVSVMPLEPTASVETSGSAEL